MQAVRDKPAPFWALESLLREYPISSAEGLALMRLAEALLRVPDAETAIALTADQLGRADFDARVAAAPHKLLASLSASAIAMSKTLPARGRCASAACCSGWAPDRGGGDGARAAVARPPVRARPDIDDAMARPRGSARTHAGLRFSYDMLGEGARTEADAQRYLGAYTHALERIAGGRAPARPSTADGISIKLSALFPRYEEAQRERVFAELLPRV